MFYVTHQSAYFVLNSEEIVHSDQSVTFHHNSKVEKKCCMNKMSRPKSLLYIHTVSCKACRLEVPECVRAVAAA